LTATTSSRPTITVEDVSRPTKAGDGDDAGFGVRRMRIQLRCRCGFARTRLFGDVLDAVLLASQSGRRELLAGVDI